MAAPLLLTQLLFSFTLVLHRSRLALLLPGGLVIGHLSVASFVLPWKTHITSVVCPTFHSLRTEYSHALVSDILRALSHGGTTLPPSLLPHIERVAAHLFQDDDCWPLGSSRFFLGILPPLHGIGHGN